MTTDGTWKGPRPWESLDDFRRRRRKELGLPLTPPTIESAKPISGIERIMMRLKLGLPVVKPTPTPSVGDTDEAKRQRIRRRLGLDKPHTRQTEGELARQLAQARQRPIGEEELSELQRRGIFPKEEPFPGRTEDIINARTMAFAEARGKGVVLPPGIEVPPKRTIAAFVPRDPTTAVKQWFGRAPVPKLGRAPDPSFRAAPFERTQHGDSPRMFTGPRRLTPGLPSDLPGIQTPGKGIQPPALPGIQPTDKDRASAIEALRTVHRGARPTDLPGIQPLGQGIQPPGQGRQAGQSFIDRITSLFGLRSALSDADRRATEFLDTKSRDAVSFLGRKTLDVLGKGIEVATPAFEALPDPVKETFNDDFRITANFLAEASLVNATIISDKLRPVGRRIPTSIKETALLGPFLDEFLQGITSEEGTEKARQSREQIDIAFGNMFSNRAVTEEAARAVSEIHETRPIKEQILGGFLSPEVLIPGGIARKGVKAYQAAKLAKEAKLVARAGIPSPTITTTPATQAAQFQPRSNRLWDEWADRKAREAAGLPTQFRSNKIWDEWAARNAQRLPTRLRSNRLWDEWVARRAQEAAGPADAVPTAPIAPAAVDVPVTGEARESIRRNIINDIEAGRESTEFMFHSGSEVESIIENGLLRGGLSTSPIVEAGYGNIIHVFRRSDLPSNIRDLGADISFGRAFDPLNPPKPIASFTRKELGGKPDTELVRGARAEELGYEIDPPDELIWSPKELAEGELKAAADERKLINRIEQAYVPTASRAAAVPAARPAEALPTATRDVAEEGGNLIPSGSPSGNVLGLKTINPELSRVQELMNIARRTVARVAPGAKVTVLDDPRVSAAFRERNRAFEVTESKANRLAASADAMINEAFDMDARGGIKGLAGIDPSVPGLPTIQDVAARLPIYRPHLNPQQLEVMNTLQRELAPYRQVMEEVGIEVGFRPDVVEGGFYIPRGFADLENTEAPIKIAGRAAGRGKAGFEEAARFSSQAMGISRRWEYPKIGEVIHRYINDVGHRATGQHVANFFIDLVDPNTGQRVGSTAAERIDPELRSLVENLRGRISSRVQTLRNQAARMGVQQQALRDINRLADSVDARRMRAADTLSNRAARIREKVDVGTTPEAFAAVEQDLNTLTQIANALDRAAIKTTSRAERAAGRRIGTKDALARLQDEWQQINRRWKVAQTKARKTPRDYGTIALPGLEQQRFPDELVNASNRILRNEGPIMGKGSLPLRTVNALNSIYRGLRSTWDNSGVGIQGLLGLGSDPKAWGKALTVNMKSWHNPRALGQFINDFDIRAAKNGLPTSDDWATVMLHLGAAESEFALRGGLGQVHGIKQANRAFGFFGDALRLEWAQDTLIAEMRRSRRTVQQIRDSGDMAKIADITNSRTGWSQKRQITDMAELLLFAPRFLESRLKTVTQAGLGLRPGANISQREARNSIVRLIGSTVLLTWSINTVLGNETDFRPIVNGRKNPNLLAIRFQGRDWKLLGTYDSLAGAIISTASGHPEDALRGLGSGIVSEGWSLISGEDFVGRPVNLNDPEQFAMHLLRSVTPFVGEDISETIPSIKQGVEERDVSKVAGGVLAVTGEIFGAISAPTSFSDAANDAAIRLGLGKRFSDLEPFQRDIVVSQQEVQEASDQQRGGTEVFRQLRQIDEEWIKELLALAASPEGIDGFSLAKIESFYRGKRRGVSMDVEFNPRNPRNDNEKALRDFYALFGTEKWFAPSGLFVSRTARQEFTTTQLELKAGWTPEQRQYVIRNTNLRPYPPRVLAKISSRKRASILESQNARDQFLRQQGLDNLIAESRKVFLLE